MLLGLLCKLSNYSEPFHYLHLSRLSCLLAQWLLLLCFAHSVAAVTLHTYTCPACLACACAEA